MIQLKENSIEGKAIRMGGMDIVVPALNMKKLKEKATEIIAMDEETDTVKKLEASCAVIHSALQRNYPDITIDEVEELVDMANLQEVTQAVMGQKGSGLGESQPA